MPDITHPLSKFHQMPLEERLQFAVETMRELSAQRDPEKLVAAYGKRVRQMLPVDRYVGLSRRDLAAPKFRITRSDTWTEYINPWRNTRSLPLFDRGILSEL